MPSRGAITAVFLISLAVWLYFYVATPDAPLGAPEIAVVVAVVGVAVVGIERLITRFRRKAPASETPAAKTHTAPDSGGQS